MAIGLRRVKIAPKGMGLYDFVAQQEGFFAAEGLDVELDWTTFRGTQSSWKNLSYFERPQDRPFLEAMEVANSACEWGSVCNTGAGMGKFVADLYGVARFAIFARPDSGIRRLAELRDVPIGVGLMAGSHFTTLRALEGVLPREHIRIQNVGGPGRRLLALRSGEVQVATLLDPEVPMAEAEGFVTLGAGEFRTLFWVSAGIPANLLASYFKALRRADDALRAEPARYMRLWERNLPPGLEPPADFTGFGLGELLFFEPYPRETFDETLAFARRWELDGNVREDSFEALVTPAMRL